MFIVTLKYLKPLSEVEKFLEAHRSFYGGVIIARIKERATLEKILAEDPFQKK